MPLKSFAFLAGLLALTACSKPESQDTPAHAAEPLQAPAVVHIGYQKIGAPFLLKARADSLNKALAAKNARAEWIEFPAGPPILEAMRGGSVDIGYVGETPPVFAQSGGVPFVYVAVDPPAPKSEAVLVPRDSKIKALAELKGKKIAVNRGSNVHYLLLSALERAKLAYSDVEVVFLAPADARSAFESGKVDAWVIWDPFQAAAEIHGARTLQDGTDLVKNQFFYVARREFADEHRPLVDAVLGEFATLSEWAGAHTEEAAKLEAASSGVEYEALLTSERRKVYRVNPITPEIVADQQKIADAFFAAKLIPNAVKIADAQPARTFVTGGN